MCKVNVALKLTPTQVQHAIDRNEQQHELLLRLRSMNVSPPFSVSELALVLDCLPSNTIDLTEPNEPQSEAPQGSRLVKGDA